MSGLKGPPLQKAATSASRCSTGLPRSTTTAGWRIDYFVVSDRVKEDIKDVIIHNDIYGSDHCPVELDIDL